MIRYIDLTGMRFGRLEVIRRCGEHKDGVWWLCRCDCGNIKEIRSQSLRNGVTKSCGCWHRDRLKIHGLYYTRLHRIYRGMIDRCYQERHIDREWYKANNITVCDEWRHDFVCFYNWAMSHGYDDTLTLDRIDNTKGYCPENCRFATPKQQANNRRSNLLFEKDGVVHTLKEWTEQFGLNYHTVYCRIRRGVPFEDAIA